MHADHSVLNSLSRTLKPVVLPQRKIRCTVGNYYVGGGQVAEVGKIYSVDSQLARALVQQQRAEYV